MNLSDKKQQKKQTVNENVDEDSILDDDIVEKLKIQNNDLKEREKRAFADYQNLVRRSRDERIQLIKMANQDILESLLEPFEHLQLAAQQLDDKGLEMVIHQFRTIFDSFGLEEIETLGKNFDVETMEVIEKQSKGIEVIKVMKKGYKLNGAVVQHAKVVLD